MNLILSDWAHNSEHLLSQGLSNPGAMTVIFVFLGGLLTSLGPCSLSLLPITIAYLAGFQNKQSAFIRSLSFCSGIILSLIILGILSSFLGKVYGQIPFQVTTLVALLAVVMGLNLLGILSLPIPIGPDPEKWKKNFPVSLGPVSAGFAFGLAGSSCTTPVLAVLLGWIAQTKNPFLSILILASFGAGQIIPLFIAGTAAGQIPNLLALKPFTRVIPPICGGFFLIIGLLSLLSSWI